MNHLGLSCSHGFEGRPTSVEVDSAAAEATVMAAQAIRKVRKFIVAVVAWNWMKLSRVGIDVTDGIVVEVE